MKRCALALLLQRQIAAPLRQLLVAVRQIGKGPMRFPLDAARRHVALISGHQPTYTRRLR